MIVHANKIMFDLMNEIEFDPVLQLSVSQQVSLLFSPHLSLDNPQRNDLLFIFASFTFLSIDSSI